MNSIDPNVIIICITAVAIVGIVSTSLLCALLLIFTFGPAEPVRTVPPAPVIRERPRLQDPAEPTDEFDKSGTGIDYTDLSTTSLDDLLAEFNTIEDRGKTPHSVSLVERKQRLAYELHKRKPKETSK